MSIRGQEEIAGFAAWRSGAATNGIGRALRLRLPPRYRTSSEGFVLFEWLDDDTVALGSVEYAVGDSFICQLSDGHCRVAVPTPDDETKRVVASLPLPG
jgi:hypothetical protein